MMLRTGALLAWLLLATGCGDDDGPAGFDGGIACSVDGDCDDGRFCNGAETCAGGACMPGGRPQCDDGVECTLDRCSEELGACVNAIPDVDGDGSGDLACGGDDCDDTDALRFPGNVEVCDVDDRDEDCDPTTFGSRDADGDGAIDARCCNGAGGSAVCGNDCDDMHPGVGPSEAEDCDTLDNDCDGSVDEGVVGTFWVDGDDDGFGSAAVGATTMDACRVPMGFAPNDDDCDDADPRANPGLPEICDTSGRDEDCDGTANPMSRCSCTGSASRVCPLMGACAAGTETCISGTWSACSVEPILESCDGADEDCDGTIDEGLRVTCWPDADNDGFPAMTALVTLSCPVPGRTSVSGCPPAQTDLDPLVGPTDCDDLMAAIRPTAEERLNTLDDDCDGLVDEGV